MKHLTKSPTCLVDDETFFKSFSPANQQRLQIAEMKSLTEKSDKELSVYLIDDDIIYLTAMEHFLLHEIPSLKIKTFLTGESFLTVIEDKPDVVILDYYLNSEEASAEDGIQILKKIRENNFGTKVIMLSCQEEVKIAINSIKNGALDYVSKGESAFSKVRDIIMRLVSHMKPVDKIKRKMSFFEIVNICLTMAMLICLLSGLFAL
jgi:two-component system, OmpR family, response regulator